MQAAVRVVTRECHRHHFFWPRGVSPARCDRTSCFQSHQLSYIPLSFTSSASFHTFLASPPLLNASPVFPSPETLFIPPRRTLFLDSFFVPSCHVCIRQCCLKQPLYSYPSLLQIPAPRHFLRPYFLLLWPCTACRVVADVQRCWLSAAIYFQRLAKLSSLTAGSRAASGQSAGCP